MAFLFRKNVGLHCLELTADTVKGLDHVDQRKTEKRGQVSVSGRLHKALAPASHHFDQAAL